MKPAFQIAAATFAAATCLISCTSPAAPAGQASIQNSCINPTEIEKQTILSDEEIRFEMRNGDVFVSHMSPACHGLKFEGGFSWQVRGTLVCGKQQTIEVLRTGNVCLLGELTREPSKT